MHSPNYLPNVKCPHCSKSFVVSVSGFGGELAVREKECRFCRQTFYVHILVETSLDKEITDASLSSYRSRIQFLNKERKQTLSVLLVKHETAQKVYKEALEVASRMRANYESN